MDHDSIILVVVEGKLPLVVDVSVVDGLPLVSATVCLFDMASKPIILLLSLVRDS